jgi:hypothetical protein
MTIDTSALRTRVQKEIELIPEDKLAELYNFIHYFRLGVEVSGGGGQQIMQFAGSWRGMPDDDFDEFVREIAERRRQAFSRRRSGEASTD